MAGTTEWLADVVGRAIIAPRDQSGPDTPVTRAQALLWGALPTPPE